MLADVLNLITASMYVTGKLQSGFSHVVKVPFDDMIFRKTVPSVWIVICV
jgi:hypothetical protein